MNTIMKVKDDPSSLERQSSLDKVIQNEPSIFTQKRLVFPTDINEYSRKRQLKLKQLVQNRSERKVLYKEKKRLLRES